MAQCGGCPFAGPVEGDAFQPFRDAPDPDHARGPGATEGGDAEKVGIDWKAFIALPDRLPRLKAARERALAIATQSHMEAAIAADPSRAASSDDQNPAMVWAEAVRAGSLTRQEFDESCMRLLALGQLSSPDYLAAEARLTAP